MIRVYKDRELKNEITTLDFGIVDAGTKKEFKFFLYNDSLAELMNLKFDIKHPEIKILKMPSAIHKDSVAEFTIEWEPSITLKEGLKIQLTISGEELWS